MTTNTTKTPQDALYQSVKIGDLLGIQEAIQAGAQINASDPQSGTALHMAARAGQPESVRTLITLGAYINVRVYGHTPLSLACSFQFMHNIYADQIDARKGPFVQIAQILLAAGADPNLGSTDERFIPIVATLHNGVKELFDMLIAHGATYQSTWMHYIIERRTFVFFPVFLQKIKEEHQSLPTTKTHTNTLADILTDYLIQLASYGFRTYEAAQVAQVLIDELSHIQASIDGYGSLTKNKHNIEQGVTAAHWAAYWTDSFMLEVLCKAGADLTRKTKKVWYPEDTRKPKGLSPLAMLEDALRWIWTSAQFLEYPDVLEEWQRIAAARGVSLQEWGQALGLPPLDVPQA